MTVSTKKSGYLTSEEFHDPREFRDAMSKVLLASDLAPGQERLAWGWRAHARRKGKMALGLFVYMMRHPGKAREITGDDEDRGGADMQAAYARPKPAATDRITDAWRRWEFRKARIKAFCKAGYRCQPCGTRGARSDLRVLRGAVLCYACYRSLGGSTDIGKLVDGFFEELDASPNP